MKIGILTLPIGHNYGGILQAWALKTVLLSLGHEPFLLKRKLKCSIKGRVHLFFKRCYHKFIKRTPGVEIFKNERNTLFKYTNKFIKREFNLLTTSNSFEPLCNKLDGIVVGSDQVWRALYTGNHLDDYYLKFASNYKIKKIAYAASFGLDKLDYSIEQKEMAFIQIEKFEAISVREESGIDLCKEINSNIKPVHLVDPTLLISKDKYKALIASHSQNRDFTPLFTYILDPNELTKKIIDHFSKKMGVEYCSINSMIENSSARLIDRIHPPIEDWLYGINNSKFIITDSFHGCAFSIIFNKDFIVLGNSVRGCSRITSLLKDFNLENRFIDMTSESINLDNLKPINWVSINEIKNHLAQRGLKYLSENLSSIK